MKGIGKIIGAAIGLFFGGWPGLVMGLLLGHFVDSAAPRHERLRDLRTAFFETLFLLMGHLAKADGRVSEQEIAVDEAIMDRMQLGRYQRSEAIALFNRGKQPGFDADTTTEHFYRAAQFQPMLRRALVEFLLDTALADGRLKPEGYQVLARIATGVAIPAGEFELLVNLRTNARAYRRPQGPKTPARPDPYRVLGVEPTASDRAVKQAYRRLMSQHHPDKLAAQGLPKEMLDLAKEKTVAIRTAWDEVRRQRGLR